MPIYDYACGACGRVTEVIHGINDHGPRFCPECGTEGSMRKTLTTPAIVFKGSGWAKVDRRASSGGRAAGSGTKAAGTSKPGTTGDHAPAETTAGPEPAESGRGGTASPSDGGGD